MARIRTIKPEFWKSQTVASWSREARMTFAGLWNYCDDHGRALDDPRLIKAEVWPLDDKATPKRIDGWLAEIAETGTIVRYEEDGRRYLAIPEWTEHQRVDHPKDSIFPEPPEDGGSVPEGCATAREVLAKPRESVALEGKGSGTGNREVEGKGTDIASVKPPPDSRYQPVFAALATLGEQIPTGRALSRGEAKRIGDAAVAVRAAGYDAEAVARAAVNYPTHFGRATITAQAIANHIARLQEPGRSNGSAATREIARQLREAGR